VNFRVSVIIPCLDEERYIARVIGDLINQDYPRSLTEVLIVDGGSTDRTPAIIQSFLTAYPIIKILHNEYRRTAHALNIGIRHSCGDVILIMSAHDLVGFCVAGRFNGALTGFLRQNRSFLAREILVRPALLWSPFFRQRCRMALRLLLRFRRVRQSPSPPKKDFEILAIAVDPVSQHSGAGRLLMQECENLARSTGYQQMTLTVACDNLQAIRFYERGGWQKVLNAGAAKWTGKMRKLLR
jgi:glycosyltransferase involved in cell wall biosynthesis